MFVDGEGVASWFSFPFISCTVTVPDILDVYRGETREIVGKTSVAVSGSERSTDRMDHESLPATTTRPGVNKIPTYYTLLHSEHHTIGPLNRSRVYPEVQTRHFRVLFCSLVTQLYGEGASFSRNQISRFHPGFHISCRRAESGGSVGEAPEAIDTNQSTRGRREGFLCDSRGSFAP